MRRTQAAPVQNPRTRDPALSRPGPGATAGVAIDGAPEATNLAEPKPPLASLSNLGHSLAVRFMTRFIPWIAAGAAIVWLLSVVVPPSEAQKNARDFARLPVLLEGRVQPLDSVARNALLQLRRKQTVRVQDTESGRTVEKLAAIDWLKEMLFHAERADTRPVFRIDHIEVLGLLGINRDDKHFSYNEIGPGLADLQREANRIQAANLRPEEQNPFEKAVMNLANRVVLYQRIKNSLKPEQVGSLVEYIQNYEAIIGPGREAAMAQSEGRPYDEGALRRLYEPFTQFNMVARFAYPLLIPLRHPGHDHDDWQNAGTAMMEAARHDSIPQPMRFYAIMNDAFRAGDEATFNRAVADYHAWLAQNDYAAEVAKGRSELFYNRLQGFYKSMVLYVFALVLACVSWFNQNQLLRRTAVALSLVALALHTITLVYRMVLEGRPPVTNLYSSAIFIGWGTVILGLVLEKFYRDGIGISIAGLTGFATLVIAHNLGMSGDTMQMLRAVLDTNFWLATHVVVVTLGYSASFVAGFLAVFYIIRGFFTATLSQQMARALSRMVYGVVCFATLFSFVGTVLGGIWADQSWGRFWGWDPKENGALLIVLWNAFYLHARWGRIFSEKALMATAVFGNVITAFSWFGTNMLGIGLHAYGFMDAAFKWLILFDATQLAVIALALLPVRYWRSFQNFEPHASPAAKPGTLVPRPRPA